MSVSKGNRVIWDWMSDLVKKKVTILDSQFVISLRTKKLKINFISKSHIPRFAPECLEVWNSTRWGGGKKDKDDKRNGWTNKTTTTTTLVHCAAQTTVVFCLQSNTINQQKHFSNMLEEKAACFLREIGRQSERALNNTKPASYTVTFLWKKKKKGTDIWKARIYFYQTWVLAYLVQMEEDRCVLLVSRGIC